MKKVLAVIVVLVLILISVVLAYDPLRIYIFGVNLNYRFNKGSKAKYKCDSSLKISVNWEKVPSALLKNFSVKDTNMKIQREVEVKVEDVEGGIALIRLINRVKNISLKIANQDISLGISKNQGLDKVFIIRIAPSGEILDLKLEGGASNEEYANMLQLLGMYVVFPEKMLRVGSTWERDAKVSIKIGNIKLDVKGGKIKYKLVKIVKYKGKYCALIEFTGDLYGNSEEGGSASSESHGKINGYMYFNYKEGYLAFLNSKIHLDSRIGLRLVKDLGNLNFKLIRSSDVNIKVEKVD